MNDVVDNFDNGDVLESDCGDCSRSIVVPVVCPLHLPADAAVCVDEQMEEEEKDEDEESIDIPMKKKSHKKYKCWWQTALKRMHKEQKLSGTYDPLIKNQKKTMYRIIKEILRGHGAFKIQDKAVLSLIHASQEYVIHRFRIADMVRKSTASGSVCKMRDTLYMQDMRWAGEIEKTVLGTVALLKE